jgi:hypothetical protein
MTLSRFKRAVLRNEVGIEREVGAHHLRLSAMTAQLRGFKHVAVYEGNYLNLYSTPGLYLVWTHPATPELKGFIVDYLEARLLSQAWRGGCMPLTLEGSGS